MFALIICHILLITSGQTTWEFVRHNRISYLKDYDDYDSPFDEGMIRNLFKFFCYFQQRDWLVLLQRAHARRRHNRKEHGDRVLLPV